MTDLQMRHGTIKIPSCSKALDKERPKFPDFHRQNVFSRGNIQIINQSLIIYDILSDYVRF